MNDEYTTLILGGGLSGLTVAHKLRLQNPKHSYLILEKEKRTGGVIKSNHDNGFITESGPHGFLDNCKESRQILAETGLDKECVKAELLKFVRYVYLNDKLNLIPQTPRKILMAPLISWPAKMRILADLWKPPLQGEPSVAKWVNHRFGPSLLPYLDAVYTGTYAGDFDKLTIDSVMPGARALEKEYGSVLLGLFARMRAGKKKAEKKEKLTMPAMTSFPDGMERLVKKLSEPLVEGENLISGANILGISREKGRWLVRSSKGDFLVRNVASALPINISLELMGPLDSSLPIKTVPQAWIRTVVFGFTDDVKIPPGYGFLTPEVEKRFSLGCLFSSNMFPQRAPAGHIVFETLIGGKRHPEKLELSDGELTSQAFLDVKEILRLEKEPVYSTVLRPAGAIPQLEKNYPSLLQWREKFLCENDGLYICGFGWDGIGLNDMMKHASKVATELIAGGRKKEGEKDVKGIYF